MTIFAINGFAFTACHEYLEYNIFSCELENLSADIDDEIRLQMIDSK